MSPTMFCNTGGVGVNNVLRSFRSHKSLKSQLQIEHMQDGEQYHQFLAPVHHQRPVPNVVHHPRRPSEASSIETLNSDTSFPRPSTSSQTEGSMDLNPLRLHPPTEDLYCSADQSLRSPPRHHFERQHFGSSSSTSSQDSADMDRPTLSFGNLQAQRGGSLEVYDGFDFGFDNRTPRGPARKNAAGGGGDYFTIPVKTAPPQPKSYWSPSPTPTPGTGEAAEDDEDVDETPGAAPRTPGSASRPRGLPLEGLSSPEYFLKRGNWKRRGIVFTAKVPMASEEETFDL